MKAKMKDAEGKMRDTTISAYKTIASIHANSGQYKDLKEGSYPIKLKASKVGGTPGSQTLTFKIGKKGGGSSTSSSKGGSSTSSSKGMTQGMQARKPNR